MSWQSPPELKPLLSEAELKFEVRRRLFGLFLGPSLFLLALLMPPPSDLTRAGMRTLGVFLWVVTWWICEPIPIPATALLSMALLVLSGIFPPQRAFGYWANWVNIFLIGAFIIGHAMNIHGLNRRFAYRVLSIKLIGGSAWRLLVAFLTATALLSSVASNVVVTLVFMAVGVGLLESLKVKPGDRFGETLIMCVAWAAGIGGIGTPIGTPPNMIAIGLLQQQLGYQVGFARWMLVGLPLALVGLASMFLVIRFVIRPDMGNLKIEPEFIADNLRRLGPMSRGEKISGAALLSALILWMLPDMVAVFCEQGESVSKWMQTHMSWSVVSILIATALFLIPLDWKGGRFVMTWPEAIKSIEWGTLALIAAALAIGDALGDPQVGLGRLFSRAAAKISGLGAPAYLFVGVNVALAVVLTNLISNNAVISTIGPLALSIASKPESTANPVALLCCMAVASSMAFALPSATPPVALVFASGHVRMLTLLRYGSILALISVFTVTVVGYTLSDRLFVWPP